jgi:hypothetical protein
MIRGFRKWARMPSQTSYLQVIFTKIQEKGLTKELDDVLLSQDLSCAQKAAGHHEH